jgi:peptide/nickel transport system permease protein
MVLYGQVYGLAGTDDQRRDLMLPLLNGIPLALSFGILGAIATSLLAMLLAASGAWFGGWVDTLLQRISDINMILPTLAIAILVFLMYSNSIWVVIWALVLLSIFGSPLKNYRSVFLQIKEQPYIEAARAYGASDWRMIWRYLVPHILPVMVPQLVTMVPVYVYYEATLAFLGVRDPFLPTWGKVIYDSLASRAFQFYPHRIMIPLVVLLVTGLGFALLVRRWSRC